MSRTKPPTDNLCRVYRGGSWCSSTSINLRASPRLDTTPLYRDDYLGFRTTQSGCRRKGVTPP